MPFFTQEQLAAAREVSAIEFLRKYRADDLVPSSARGEFELRSHDSFKINGESSVWHWKSRDIGGKSALDYLVHVEGVHLVPAVLQLCGERPVFQPVSHGTVEQHRPAFKLPPRFYSTDRVEQYLMSRGISREVIRECIRQEILYESIYYHNCVFVGRDTEGIPRYAALRGIYRTAKPFKREVPGSDKRYSFCVSPTVPTKRVAIFEAAVDVLAEMTLSGERTDKWRLSCGGIYAPTEEVTPSETTKPPKALEEFLSRHPEIEEIEICFDNDPAGRYASAAVLAQYSDRYRVLDHPPAIEGGDYGDLALQTMQAKAARSRAAFCR